MLNKFKTDFFEREEKPGDLKSKAGVQKKKEFHFDDFLFAKK